MLKKKLNKNCLTNKGECIFYLEGGAVECGLQSHAELLRATDNVFTSEPFSPKSSIMEATGTAESTLKLTADRL